MEDTRGKAWAVFFSVIMVLSMIALSVSFAGTAVAFTGDGNGTEPDDPYQITDWEKLYEVRDEPGAYYELQNNLDNSTNGYDTYNADDSAGWDPIGDDSTKFTGSFDGQGYTIEGLYIDRADVTLNGLFGYIGTDGEVRNLGVTNVDLTGQNQMGGLAGRNNGLIDNSFATGVVDGRERTGGLVGHNEGEGTITNSYSGVEVISDHEKIGGLVGDNSNGAIKKSYSFGVVDEADTGSTVGGLTGREDGGGATNVDSFWDTETSGQTSSGGGTGKTTAEMQDVATFTDESTDGLNSAWDFVDDPSDDTASEDIWNISTSLNGGYPYLGDNPPYQVDVALESPEDEGADIETPTELAVTATSPVDGEFNISFSSMIGWDIKTTTFTRKESTKDSGPEGIHFSPDGETMYELGYSDEEMHQYQLTAPWDISTATHEETQDTVNDNSADIFISPEGDHLYELARNDAEIYQLEITDGDISTADTDSPKTTIDTQGSDPEDIHFSPDGTKLFELDSDSQTVYKYELDIAWELSTATYTDSVDAESGATGLFIDQDGDTLYQTSETESKIYQSELEAAWNISSISEDTTSVSIDEDDGHGLFINPTGTELYSVGRSDEAVYQYSLDASPELIDSISGVQSGETATYSWEAVDSSSYYQWRATADDGSERTTSEIKSFSTDQKDRPNVELNSPKDGDADVSAPPELNVTATSDENDNLNVSFYEVTGWDIETARYDEVEVDTEDTGPEGIHFSANGTILYVMGYSDEEVYQFSLTTPWDLSTAEFEKSQQNVDPNSADLFVSPDGQNYYELEKADGEIHWIDMDGGDINTVDIEAIRHTMQTQSSDPEDIHFSPDGTKLYELSNSDIYEYDLSTAWDLSTATYTGKSISSQDSASTGLFIHSNGTRMYEVGDGDDKLHQFTLSTAWDLSTATADEVSTNLEHGDAHSLYFKPTGTQLYYVGRDAERAYSYSLADMPELIDTASDVDSGTDATYTWDTVDSLRYYEWLVTAADGSADYTSSTWNFTTDDTTKIESWSQLNDVRDDPSGTYVLSSDLDEDSEGYETYGADWGSIGTFEGNFDGQGHTIADLSGSNGLFSKIDGATIEDVTLDGVDVASESTQIGGLVGTVEDTERSTISGVNVTGTVNGETETGGLIGHNSGADIINSSATGSIPDGEGGKQGGLIGYEAGGNTYTDVYAEMDVSLTYGEENDIGGLIGLFDDSQSGGSITNSYATGNVLGENNVGGLIGNNRGADITDSYATGTIPAGEGAPQGGLVGYEAGGNTYTRVYATGDVSPGYNEADNMGGLIGLFDDFQTGGSITDAYATGDVHGNSFLGGLIGRNNGAEITNAYSTGWVRDRTDSGGLIGSNDGGSYSNAFWDTNTSEQDDSAGGTAKTTGDMKDVATFTDSDTDGLDDPWDFVGNPNDDEGEENIWNIVGSINDGYPYLEQLADDDPASVSGDVFESDGETQVIDGTVEIYFDQQNDSGAADGTADLSDGSYSFEGLGADDYHLVVTGATDHQDDERNISLNAGESATEDFTLTEITVVDSISVDTPIDTLDYDSGDALNLSGLVINETLSDGTTETTAFDDAGWSNYTAVPADGDPLADSDDGTNVTVTHTDSGETTDTSTLTVNTVVDSISVETQPDTLTYDSGDALDLTGLVINETLSDGTTDTTSFGDADWSEYTADPSDETTLEGSDDGSPVTVTHTDSGNTADTDPLTVNTVVESISVETQPNLAYDSGEALDLTGMEVTETYSDGSTATVTYGDSDWDSNYSVGPSDGTTLRDSDDGSTVTVTHTDSGETVDTSTLTVNAVVDSISVETQPTLTYDSGEALDLTRMEVTESYSDGSTATVTYGDSDWDSNYSVDTSDGTTLEDSDEGSTVTVTHTDSEETANTDTLTVNAVVDSISVETQPALTYDSGESLGLTGMEVAETYSDGSTSTVTYGDSDWDSNYSVDPSDETTLEDADDGSTVTVTHTDSGETADTSTLTVNAVVEFISVETQPNLTYDSGESLNLSGIEVTETYSDGSTATVTYGDSDWDSDYSVDTSDGTALDDSDDGSTVTATHTDSGETANTDALTVNTVVKSIEVTTQPTLTYDSGESLDLNGMEVTETYSDGSTSTVTYGDSSWDSDYSVGPSDGTTLRDSDDGSTVTVTHTDSGETVDTSTLTVNTVVESISVETQPNFTYDSGEALDLTGMEVTETYSDGSTSTVTYGDSDWDSDYSVDPSDGTVLEEGEDGSAVTVTHTDSGETAGTDTLTVNTDGDGSDGADSIAIQTEPDGTQTAGETLTSPPKVNVTDEHGNAVEGVDVTVTENSDYSFDSGTTTQTTGSDGVATFDDLVIETAGTIYELNFSISSGDHNVTAGDTASSQTLEVESAAADAITIQTQPDVSQTANETLTGLPAVNVTDEHGNAVEGTNVTVALKPVGDPQDFGYTSTLTVLTNESGIATFDNLVVNTTTGDYRLEFKVNPSVTSEIFSMEAAADTTPPEITNFSVNNTEGQTVEVSFDSDKELSKINSNGTDDAGGTNLVMSNFTQSGNLTNGFTYTATLSDNGDGMFGATLDTAEDANDNDGASAESDSVMIDTSNDGDGGSDGDDSSGESGGDDSSGESGGDDSSGESGGDDSSGEKESTINNTDTGDNQSQSVTRQPSADESIGFTVSDSDGAGNILLSLTDEADDATEEPTGRNVDHDSLSVQPTETGTREFNISVSQWDASSETNESTNDRFFEGTGSSAIGYVEVTHSNSDDDIEGVTFQFRVQSAYLDEHDIESEDIALYRDETGRWNELDATEVETTDTHHVFEAESPGLSLFAVGAPDSTEPTSGPDAAVTVSPSVVTVGEEVTLDGSDSTNEDGEIAAYNWSIYGETLTGETVTVTADEPGEYTVKLTVTNDAGETDTTVTDLTVTAGEETSGNGLPTTTDDETPVGFAIYAIIVLLLVIVIVAVIAWGVRRRRSEGNDSI
ncbi:GLUG motif-containing protein [Halalkalirubrum salinum]|uniref:GLUG motif-containing protein n=1 Tax=Halalkalirubrum salinum TaxID=2563889 RepID=UPI0010FAF929|nr:GLUG motif-containing protein [Halalkalirubrum salinum]